jgi:hypothetical protein
MVYVLIIFVNCFIISLYLLSITLLLLFVYLFHGGDHRGRDPVQDFPIGSIGLCLGTPVKVFYYFNTVIRLSHLCCHNVLYVLNNPSNNFTYTVALHFRILRNFKHPSSSPLLKLTKHTSIFLKS